MQLSSLKGWMPVDAVVVDGRPGLSWLDMTDVSLAEPFLQQTVERVKRQHPDRNELFTEFDTLVQLERTFDSVPPTGFIFHSSRCGSTLLANACRAIAGAIVLSEPATVDKVLARFITDVDQPGTKELLYSVFLRGLINALGQRRTGDERYLFVKFSCCSISQIERIRRIWPSVPSVFLYRDPVETIVSNVNNPPAWLQDEDRRVLASIIGSSPAAVSEMTPEELCARSIAGFYLTARRVANDRTLLLNYNQLSPAEMLNVLQFFGVSPAAAERETIIRVGQKYSKSVSGTQSFIADSDTKQEAASELVREMAEAWANGPYRLLEQKRLEMNRHELNSQPQQTRRSHGF